MIALGHVARRITAYALLFGAAALLAAGCASRTDPTSVHHHGGSAAQRELAERAYPLHVASWEAGEGYPPPPVELHVWHERNVVTCHGVTGEAVYCAPRIHHGSAPGLRWLQHEWGHAAGHAHPAGGSTPYFDRLDRRGAEVAAAASRRRCA